MECTPAEPSKDCAKSDKLLLAIPVLAIMFSSSWSSALNRWAPCRPHMHHCFSTAPDLLYPEPRWSDSGVLPLCIALQSQTNVQCSSLHHCRLPP